MVINMEEKIVNEFADLTEQKRIISSMMHELMKYDDAQKFKERCATIFNFAGLIEAILGSEFDETLFTGCLLHISNFRKGGEGYTKLKQRGSKYLAENPGIAKNILLKSGY
jgi:hypothetical protein